MSTLFKIIAAVGLVAAVPAFAGTTGTVGSAAAPGTFPQVMKDYEAIRTALLHDSTGGVVAHAKVIGQQAGDLAAKFDAGRAGVPESSAPKARGFVSQARDAARKLATAKNLDEARAVFGTLSDALIGWRDLATGGRPEVVYCAMAKKSWLQPAGDIGNPYYGQSMATCGEVLRK